MADSPLWLMVIQSVSYLGGAGAAATAAAKYLLDRKSARASERDAAQRKRAETAAREKANEVAERDLKWRQAESAQRALEALVGDKVASNAMIMLDWSSRQYPLDAPKWEISSDEVSDALRTEGRGFDDKEIFIRDCFDQLFWHFERIQHLIDVGLMDYINARFPVSYYAAKIEQDWQRYVGYLDAYEFRGAKKLILEMRRTYPINPKPYVITDNEMPIFGEIGEAPTHPGTRSRG